MSTILSIAWYKILPALFGGQKGIDRFNRALSQHHTVSMICSSNNVAPAGLPYRASPILPISKSQFFRPKVWKTIREIAIVENPAFIILEHPYHGIAGIKAMKATGARLILHSHNIESMRFRELGKWWWRILLPYERWVHRKAHLCLFKTEEDRQWAIDHFRLQPASCIVVPYGIDRPIKEQEVHELRLQHSIGSGERILLFAGTLDYAPNERAVRDIFHELIPRLAKRSFSYKIIICGRGQEELRKKYDHPQVQFAGVVDRMADYFSVADAFINPVRLMSGIQTKTIEAIAHGSNVVCFDGMINGIPREVCGGKLLLAKEGNWDNFADMIIKACDSNAPTPENFYQHFDWQNAIRPLLHWIATQPQKIA